MTTTTQPATVAPSLIPGLWVALLPDGSRCRVPDLDRPGRSAVALFTSAEQAARHLAGLGFEGVTVTQGDA